MCHSPRRVQSFAYPVYKPPGGVWLTTVSANEMLELVLNAMQSILLAEGDVNQNAAPLSFIMLPLRHQQPAARSSE